MLPTAAAAAPPLDRPVFSDKLLVTIRGEGAGGRQALQRGSCAGGGEVAQQAIPSAANALRTRSPENPPAHRQRNAPTHTHAAAGAEDRGLVFQAEGRSTPLLDAVRNVFLRPSPEAPPEGDTPRVVHRLAVFEPHGEITNIVSQTGGCAVLGRMGGCRE